MSTPQQIKPHRRIAHYLSYVGAIFFSLFVLQLAAFLLWNLGVFLFRISEALWEGVFNKPWL